MEFGSKNLEDKFSNFRTSISHTFLLSVSNKSKRKTLKIKQAINRRNPQETKKFQCIPIISHLNTYICKYQSIHLFMRYIERENESTDLT